MAPDGAVVTSLDTEGGWTPPGGSPIPRLVGADTLLVRIGADGVVRWTRRVGGPGYQRGKSIAVGPDGSIDFGGDTPVDGVGRQAWLSRWTAGGTRRWMERWGGAGDDLAKGVVDDGRSVWAVGPAGPDMAVRRFVLDGTLLWTATVTGDAGGADMNRRPWEAASCSAGSAFPGMAFHTASGATVPLDDRNVGTPWLAHYRPDGSVGFVMTIPEPTDGSARSRAVANGSTSTSWFDGARRMRRSGPSISPAELFSELEVAGALAEPVGLLAPADVVVQGGPLAAGSAGSSSGRWSPGRGASPKPV